MHETELAKAVVAYLHDYHWTVYQEVQFRAYGGIADIVAVQGPAVWIVECKMSFGLAVLDQAWRWTPRAHYVSVAVPIDRYGRRDIDPPIMRALGVGLLEVGEGRRWQQKRPSYTVREAVRPPLNRAARTKNTLATLQPEHQTFAEAGSASGARWSPFQATCVNLAKYVATHPGCFFQDAIDCIEHHYSTPASAKSALRNWLDSGQVAGVRMERENRRLRLYPETPRGG